MLVADAPYIHLGRLEILLLIDLQPFDIIGEQSPDIRPAGAASKKIELFISLEIADDRMLIHSSRVAAGSGGGDSYVGDAGDHGPYPTGCPIAGRKTVVEEQPLLTHAVEKRGRVQRVAPHAAFISAETFADHQYYVWFYGTAITKC